MRLDVDAATPSVNGDPAVGLTISGSMAAVMRDWASRTRRMASSISLCAASELFACGLTMALLEWFIFNERPANSIPLNCSARPTLLCSVNSTKANRVG